MSLPELSSLDDMTRLIAGPNMTFAMLGPESRIQIVSLVNQGDIADAVAEIVVHASAISDEMSYVAKMSEGIRDVLGEIEKDTTNMGNWFNASDVLDKYNFGKN